MTTRYPTTPISTEPSTTWTTTTTTFYQPSSSAADDDNDNDDQSSSDPRTAIYDMMDHSPTLQLTMMEAERELEFNLQIEEDIRY